MYKVLLVDDDYPVLELLSEAISWEQLGMSLHGVHENGLAALEHALTDMPDILITDIGMPKMNGIELIQKLKERNPHLRVAILSCHSEFHYAQQAMKLHVQDYLLKDMLDPLDLHKLLLQFKQSLDQEKQAYIQQLQLRHIADRSKMALKGTFFRNVIHQPIVHPHEWMKEAETFNFRLAEGEACLPVIGFVDDYRLAKKRYMEQDILRFALSNVFEEVVGDGSHTQAVHFPYGDKESFILHMFRPNLKVNMFEEAGISAARIQTALQRSLKISMSFIIGDISRNLEELKKNLTALLQSTGQRFYLKDGAIAKKRLLLYDNDDLFSYYDKAIDEFRHSMVSDDAHALTSAVIRWITVIEEKEYPPDMVKDWVLKLLLDLKLKYQSLQLFRSSYSADILHKEIPEIDSLTQLKQWLIDHFQAASPVVGEILEQSRRIEVQKAMQYVSLNLDKRISLEEMSKSLHLNSSYFSRLFRRETGQTFIEYVTRSKMDRAKELLDQTSYSVNKICELLRYDNQSYFIKTFKSYAGVTPVEYRGKSKQ